MRSTFDLPVPLASALVLALALATPAVARAATYYVDFTRGDDSRSAAQAQDPSTPWKTWANFQGSRGADFSPGDFILFRRGQTWRRSDFGQEFRPSAMDGVTFGAYGTGPRPVFDADNNTPGVHAVYVGYNGAATNVVFEGIEFTNSVPKNTAGYIVTAHVNSPHLTFRDCYFDATNMNTTVYADINETLSISADYLTIDRCTFYGEPPYNRHAAYAGGEYAVFTNNIVRGFGVSGLKLNGDRCAFGTIAHNLIIDSNVNIMLGETSRADVYGNISILTARASIEGGGTANHIRVEDDDGVDGQMPRGNRVYNNTFVGNGDANIIMYRSRKSGASYDAWDVFQDNEFRNNLWYLVNESSDLMTMLGEGAQHPMPSDYSIFYSDGDTRWRNNSIVHDTLSDWRTTANAPSDLEAHSTVVTTPSIFASFVVDSDDPGSYRLRPDSPAVGAASPIAGLVLNNGGSVTDFFGNPYTSDDIGAIATEPSGSCVSRGGEVCAAGEDCIGGTLDAERCCTGACIEMGSGFPTGVAIEAEAGELMSPMEPVSDERAQAGAFIMSSTDEAGQAAYVFRIERAGEYRLAVLALAPTISDDSFYVGLDGEDADGVDGQIYDLEVSTEFRWDTVRLRGGQTWEDPEFDPKVWELSVGLHTLRFYTREGGTQLDQLRLESVGGALPDGGAADGGAAPDAAIDASDDGGALPRPDGGDETPETSGCGCRAAPGPTPSPLVGLGLLALLWHRRQRRRRRRAR